jgi:tetratricopeptide (TPR) repeat protein
MQAMREEPAARAPSKHQAPAAPPVAQAVDLSSTPESPSLRDRRKPRKLSSALKRLDRELKQLRQPSSSPVEPQQPSGAPSPGAGQAGASSQQSYARARVDQLMRMRAATLNQQQQQTQASKAPVAVNGQDMLRAAQKELRDQQFARAHELMRKACEADPENQIYSMYCMYAALRANALKQDDINKLRLMLRDKISDDQHKGFAYYALGHVALMEKKDDAAEKFFQKAVELDKNNKDAERYARIIAVKRKTAAEQEKANKIFGIEIGPKKGQ